MRKRLSVRSPRRGREIAAREIIVSARRDSVYKASWLSRIEPEFRKDSGCVAVVGSFRFADAPWWGQAWTDQRRSQA